MGITLITTILVFLTVLLSLVSVLLLAKAKLSPGGTVKLIINGFKIGIIGLICYSGYVIMFQQQETFNLYSMVVCFLTFAILNKTKVHPIFLILSSGLIGYYFNF